MVPFLSIHIIFIPIILVRMKNEERVKDSLLEVYFLD
jgi:hypothetical protein